MTPIEKNINVMDENNVKYDSTENRIYKYHCQHQAESFAWAILSVPEDYPLQAGLPEDFRIHFSKLCELAADIYMDMAKQPEAYGLMLVDIQSDDHNLARNGYRTIHRFVDTLSNLSGSGDLSNHQLIVNTELFKKAAKKGAGLVSGPVPKYELILSRLVDFGFVISGFEGKPFGKKTEFFTVEYPDYPEMTDAVKMYFECWNEMKFNKADVKIWPKEYHHHYYRFDYKITADRGKIPMMQWVSDEADYLGYTPEQKAFSMALYEYSLQYKDVCFDGDYTCKSKRIARICQSGYTALEKPMFLFHVRLKNMDKYSSDIDAMPANIRRVMEIDSCRHCSFQGATPEHCKFRVHWTMNGQSHEGCAHACFYFDHFDVNHVPDYFKLLELEYGLKKEKADN